MKSRIPILLLSIFIGVTASAQHLTHKNYQRRITSDMDFRIVADSIYYDRDEIRVIDWMEYQFWLEKVYGKDSPQYLASMPDTNIVRQQMPLVEPMVYMKNPAHIKLPVLGVSTEQARAYCRWRTDRVAEYILVSMKLLKWDSEQTPDNFFTIQNNENLPADLHWLVFSLAGPTTETRYGFRCVARWQ